MTNYPAIQKWINEGNSFNRPLDDYRCTGILPEVVSWLRGRPNHALKKVRELHNKVINQKTLYGDEINFALSLILRNLQSSRPLVLHGLFQDEYGDVFKLTKDGNKVSSYLLVFQNGKPTWNKVSGAAWTLSEKNRLPLEKANEYGIYYNRCFICLHPLVTDDSIHKGIGPKCITKLSSK